MSAAHLKSFAWKPGQSGNPAGRSAKQRAADVIRNAKYAEFMILLGKLCDLTKHELEGWLLRSEATTFELAFGHLVNKAAEGDMESRKEFSDRLFGKVRDLPPEDADEVSQMTEEELNKKLGLKTA